MFFVNDPGPWPSYILRGDNVGRPINEVTQKYLNEQLQFDNFISMQQQLQIQQFQNKGVISSLTPSLSLSFLIDTSIIEEGTTTNDNQFQLPLTDVGIINFTIDWGDGTTDIITSYNQTETLHTYTTPGEYYITITSGIIRGWSFNNSGDAVKFKEIYDWSVWDINTTGSFYGCSNLVSSATSVPTISTNDLTQTFRGCTNFNGPIGNWDMSGVTSLFRMLQFCASFNQDVSSWDVSNVINLGGLFAGAILFNQDITSWDVSNVGSFSGTFSGAASFNQDISVWDVSSATTMFQMFATADAFTYDISSWDVSNVGNFISFMQNKTPANYSSTNLNAIYNTWSALPTLQSNVTASFGTINYTAAGAAGRNTLVTTYNWLITDGGQV